MFLNDKWLRQNDVIRSRDTTQDNHIQKIYPLGEKFNPNKHQAVCEISDTDHSCGHIIQVIQSGYMIHDRLLRPAMVGVVKNIKHTDIQEDTSDTIQSTNVSE